MNDLRTAVVIVHEIFGLNAHIERVRERLDRYGCDVFAPHLLGSAERSFDRADEGAAYPSFMRAGGVAAMSRRLISFAESLRGRYDRVGALGFSVGATSAWIAAGTGVFDAVVCCYGSRIRDVTDLPVACPCLLLFAAHEPSFDPRNVVERVADRESVTAYVYDHGHGFCDRDSPNYDADAAEHALKWAIRFLGLAGDGE